MAIKKHKFTDEDLLNVVFDGNSLHDGMTSFADHMKNIDRAINPKAAGAMISGVELKILLQAQVQCDSQKSTSVAKGEEKASGAPSKKSETRVHEFRTRPFVEYLFAERSNEFHGFIKGLYKSRNSELIQAFNESLKGTDIHDTTSLYAWNEDMEANMRAAIKKINAYGLKLQKTMGNGAKRKGDEVVRYAGELRAKLDDFIKTISVAGERELINLKILMFKRNAFNTYAEKRAYINPLEEKAESPFVDESASVTTTAPAKPVGFHIHRDPFVLRCIAEGLISLFTLGIANLIQRAMTHGSAAQRWTFFQHTGTEIMRLELQDSLKYVQPRVIDMRADNNSGLTARNGR